MATLREVSNQFRKIATACEWPPTIPDRFARRSPDKPTFPGWNLVRHWSRTLGPREMGQTNFAGALLAVPNSHPLFGIDIKRPGLLKKGWRFGAPEGDWS